MDIEVIKSAVAEKPELLDNLTSFVLESEKGKAVISSKADLIFKENLGSHVSEIYKKDDESIFEILGVKPKVYEDGTKQKTNELKEQLFKELKTLKAKEGSLEKDAKVAELTAQIEHLKKDGAGKLWETTFNTEAEKWKLKEEGYLKTIEEANLGATDIKKQYDLERGLRDFKYKENLPKSVIDTIIKSEVEKLKTNSKVENGVVIYLDEKGAQISNAEYEPESSLNILKVALKDILADTDSSSGGSADLRIGSLASNSEGKKTITLPVNSFKTQVEFTEVSQKAMLNSGIVKNSPEWIELGTEAHKKYKVSEMPFN